MRTYHQHLCKKGHQAATAMGHEPRTGNGRGENNKYGFYQYRQRNGNVVYYGYCTKCNFRMFIDPAALNQFQGYGFKSICAGQNHHEYNGADRYLVVKREGDSYLVVGSFTESSDAFTMLRQMYTQYGKGFGVYLNNKSVVPVAVSSIPEHWKRLDTKERYASKRKA
jgi:hypothetical protein